MHISPRTLLFLTTVLSTSLTSALPHHSHAFDERTTLATTTLTLPSSSLPAPPANLVLKYIALGLGTQNYSCPSLPSSCTSSSTANAATCTTTPTSVGALATLYDATRLLNMTATALGSLGVTALGVELPCLADSVNNGLTLPVLGRHYFDSLGRPTFDLSSSSGSNGAFLSAKKVATAPAPATACRGRNGVGAVDWLMLVDNGEGGSRGVSVVYRVETAGGKAGVEECQGPGGGVESDYSALYWFYG